MYERVVRCTYQQFAHCSYPEREGGPQTESRPIFSNDEMAEGKGSRTYFIVRANFLLNLVFVSTISALEHNTLMSC